MIVPADPLIFHITHVDNLAGIVREGGLWCDRQRIGRELGSVNIGHQHIKQRRMDRVVSTGGGGTLADYVPFYFCARSVMLCAIHYQHQDYRGGQEPIVHLVSSLSRATALGRAWAFTDRHAELEYALFYDDVARLDEVRWPVMPLTYWADVKQERQAEFLVRDFFPWNTVTAIHVINPAMHARVEAAIRGSAHVPPIVVSREWYY